MQTASEPTHDQLNSVLDSLMKLGKKSPEMGLRVELEVMMAFFSDSRAPVQLAVDLADAIITYALVRTQELVYKDIIRSVGEAYKPGDGQEKFEKVSAAQMNGLAKQLPDVHNSCKDRQKTLQATATLYMEAMAPILNTAEPQA